MIFGCGRSKSDKKSADWVSPLQKEMNDVDSSAKAHANTESAFEAWVKLGDIYNENAMYEKAEGYYFQAFGTTSVESKKTAAKYSLAFTYENRKNTDKAISSLNDVLSSTFKAVHEDATLALARNYEKMGKADKAKELYAQFKPKFPEFAFPENGGSAGSKEQINEIHFQISMLGFVFRHSYRLRSRNLLSQCSF